MSPTEPQFPAPEETTVTPPPPAARPNYHWYHKASAVLFIAFCLELGLFLLVFPWTDYWEANYFSTLAPELREYWQNMYVRGAISGLGAADLYISFVEIMRLRRFAGR
jgi:hypothetical protein